MVLTTGVGFTVIVKFTGIPLQVTLLLINWGVAEIVAVITEFPPLIAWKAGIFPLPEEPNPIVLVLFDHI